MARSKQLLIAAVSVAPSTAFAHGGVAEPLYALIAGAFAGFIAGIVCWGHRDRLTGCVAACALGLAGLMYIICLGPMQSGLPRSWRESAEDAASNWMIFALPTFVVVLLIMLGISATKNLVAGDQSTKDDNAS